MAVTDALHVLRYVFHRVADDNDTGISLPDDLGEMGINLDCDDPGAGTNMPKSFPGKHACSGADINDQFCLINSHIFRHNPGKAAGTGEDGSGFLRGSNKVLKKTGNVGGMPNDFIHLIKYSNGIRYWVNWDYLLPIYPPFSLLGTYVRMCVSRNVSELWGKGFQGVSE